MGFFSEDMAPMLGVYEAETSELVTSMDAIATRVEREGRFSPEDIAELFRCAHTIKGSSAMMGLDALATLTHGVEDLFDVLRGDPSLAEGHMGDILDHVYSFCDYVKDEIERMEEADFAPTDASGLAGDVAACVAGLVAGEGLQAADVPAKVGGTRTEDDRGTEKVPVLDSPRDMDPAGVGEEGRAPVPEDVGGVVVKVSFKPDVPMVNARAKVIVRQLGSQVGVRACVPEDLAGGDAARTIEDEGLLVVVGEEDVEKAKRLLAKNSFIRRIDVLEAATHEPSVVGGGQGRPDDGVSGASEKFVTLRWETVRELQNMVGEFLSQVTRLKTLSERMPEEIGVRNAVLQTSRLVDELVYQVDKMAMVSMSAMVPQLSRVVRDMCRASGKRVSFEVQGGGIDIDRNLYNSIADPLLHIIRNAVDHGIESADERLAAGKDARGKVTLVIENLGARVAFRVADDGRGIDTDAVLAQAEAKGMLDRPARSYSRKEALHLVMAPGLSTSRQVTQYSGRGVGMDVVSAVVRDFNGSVDIESQPGQGTTITLFMPVAVTSVECLRFRIGQCLYHMPLFNLVKIFSAKEAEEHLAQFEGSMLFEYDKRQLSVLDVHALLGSQGAASFYVVCHSLDDEFVIGVDDVLGEFGCANKTLPTCLDAAWQEVCPVRNVTIMDDDRVGYVLNAPALADYAQGRRQLPEAVEQGERVVEEAVTFEPDLAATVPSWGFVFRLGEEWFAVPVERVERLAPLTACSEVPRSLPHLKGLTNYRNHVIAVFDLAASAGAEGACLYVLIMDDGRGKLVGFAITSAIGVRDLSGAVAAEEQAVPRVFANGLRTTLTVTADVKEPPITLLDFCS